MKPFATLKVESETSNVPPSFTKTAPPSLASSIILAVWLPVKVESEIFTFDLPVAWIPPPLPFPSTRVLFRISDLFSTVTSEAIAYIAPPFGRTSSAEPAFFTALESWIVVLSNFNLDPITYIPPPLLWFPVWPFLIVDFVTVTLAPSAISIGLPIPAPSKTTLSNVTVLPFIRNILIFWVTSFKVNPLPWIFPVKVLGIVIVLVISIFALSMIFCSLLFILSCNSCWVLTFPCRPVSALALDAITILWFKIVGWTNDSPNDNDTAPIVNFLIENLCFL